MQHRASCTLSDLAHENQSKKYSMFSPPPAEKRGQIYFRRINLRIIWPAPHLTEVAQNSRCELGLLL